MNEQNRRKRVNRLKKIILITAVALILIPIILCCVLLYKVSVMEAQIQELGAAKQQMEQIQTKQEELQVLTDSPKQEEEKPKQLSAEWDSGIRKVYLTFDDGPSAYTDEILDVLDKYHVKATFFVVGRTDEHSVAMYRRIAAEGHTLGMHSYSHEYRQIYASEEAFAADMSKLQNYLERVTGVKPTVCRFPGGSSNRVSGTDMQELIRWVTKQGMVYYDWNISSRDASPHMLSAEQIVDNATAEISRHERSVILMHDAAEKRTTVEALPLVIEKILAMEDTQIMPITEETVPVQHVKAKALNQE